jgi:uncharacterized protein with HEPN domain
MENKKRLEFYLQTAQNSLNDLKNYIEKIDIFLPIDYKNYEDLITNSKETLDAIAFRFNKIQSTLGEKIFKLFLIETGFDINEKSFFEILNELERLNILTRKEWIILREIRNKISHDYPQEIAENIENLNKMVTAVNYFEKILTKIKEKLEAIKR